MPELIGKTLLGQFRVDAFVASGGMGAVYRVWDLKRNVPLAMKVLHAELAEDPSILKRFQREANALKKLTHPNIVPFYGLQHTMDMAFLLERFIDGPALKEILRQRRGKLLPLSEVLVYLKGLCAALGYAHSNGVVHCDVKPGNVMLDLGGNIYLTDFGVARHADSTTTTLAAAGTPAYMAPEHILGKAVTPATDVYALGVMTFEMLTGQRPFRGAELGTESSSSMGSTMNERVRYGHLHTPPPDPRTIKSSISSELAAVVLKALNKEPIDRYETATEFFAALCAAVATSPTQVADRASLPKFAIEAPVPAPTPIPAPEVETRAKTELPRTGIVPGRKISPVARAWLIGGFAVAAALMLVGGLMLASASSNRQKPSALIAQNTSAPINAPIKVMDTATPELSSTQALQQASLAMPEMAVNSTFRYVDGTLLVAVPGGPFTMGRSYGVDNPEHQVTLNDFWIYSTKVTNRQYARCVSAGICSDPDTTQDVSYNDYAGFDYPVTGVDWDQAQTYCTYVMGKLPTEAEWEKAARGPNANTFPWGNDTPSCDFLNFNRCIGNTTSVTSYPQGKSYYGALDMEGNAYEWVADWYDPAYYKKGHSTDPEGPTAGLKRVARSSGYTSSVDSANSAVRSPLDPVAHRSDLGFRCVVKDPTVAAPSCVQVESYGPRTDLNAQVSLKNVPAICPSLTLDFAEQRCGTNSTYVTVNSNIAAQTTVSGLDQCTLLGGSRDSFPQLYDCHSVTTVTVGGFCSYQGLGAPYCNDHYVLDPGTGTCKWDGSEGLGQACPLGINFDPTNKCCSATLGGKEIYPLCAVGSTLADFGSGKYGCITIGGLQTVAPISKDVPLQTACK